MRISEWSLRFNVTIERAQGAPGEVIYQVRDLFTTRDGSWDVSDKPGSLPQWARDDYLKPLNHPQYNSDAGADHHLFGAMMEDGGLRPWGNIHFYTHGDNGNHTEQRVKLHGWANIPLWPSSSFVPERGERGAWAWYPKGLKADVVKGGGLPANHHISWFCVWEAVEVPVIVTSPVEPPVVPDNGGTTLDQRVSALEAAVKRHDDNIAALWKMLSK